MIVKQEEMGDAVLDRGGCLMFHVCMRLRPAYYAARDESMYVSVDVIAFAIFVFSIMCCH